MKLNEFDSIVSNYYHICLTVHAFFFLEITFHFISTTKKDDVLKNETGSFWDVIFFSDQNKMKSNFKKNAFIVKHCPND